MQWRNQIIFHGLKVGEVTKASGVSIRALHYYDEIGLLKPSSSTDAGHRLYAHDDIGRLQHIKSLQQLGFSLAEIRDFLDRDEFSLGLIDDFTDGDNGIAQSLNNLYKDNPNAAVQHAYEMDAALFAYVGKALAAARN